MTPNNAALLSLCKTFIWLLEKGHHSMARELLMKIARDGDVDDPAYGLHVLVTDLVKFSVDAIGIDIKEMLAIAESVI